MKLDLGPELEDFRAEIRTWVDENRPPGLEELDERAVYLGTAHLSGPAAEAYELWSARLGRARFYAALMLVKMAARRVSVAERDWERRSAQVLALAGQALLIDLARAC